jgi:hypothetical protein
MCRNSTIPNLIDAAPNLTSFPIACGGNVMLSTPGVYKFNSNTTCGGIITFNGTNQIVDCQGNTIGAIGIDIPLLLFTGNGPYIVQNCALLVPVYSRFSSSAIFVSGSVADELQTIDILIKDTSFQGNNGAGQNGAIFRPASGKFMCASITESDFMESGSGVAAAPEANSQVFLDMLDVKASSNNIGLFADGSGTQLNVNDSLFCTSIVFDVRLQNDLIGSFSNNTCSKTDPNTRLSEICSMPCA